jgi:hypothetical protein
MSKWVINLIGFARRLTIVEWLIMIVVFAIVVALVLPPV